MTEAAGSVVVLACHDLMTASRFSAPGVEVLQRRGADKVLAALDEHPGAVLFVDLTDHPGLARTVRESGRHPGRRIVGFAPHVQEDLLEAAQEWCDDVVPRGAAIKRFAKLVVED